ncbi:DEAD/DEAH box helicase [Imbroritus primus]|uniref:DEAD/DEAH box helicase n=1 Tax=Imbroritus primus TaxID=3058603 RepID=UPI003D160B48
MSFSELGLSDKLVRAVTELGYTVPTPIQRQAIPAVLGGGDLLAGAQTGTGKTAGFTLPLLQRLSGTAAAQAGNRRLPRALVLTPTRELAAQVEESVRDYGKYLPLRSMVMFGGVGINPQVDLLRKGVDIVVATPGRLLDHAGQRTIDLSNIEILVLDEADRMLDMGFIHDIRKVLALLPQKRQNLLFSATFSDEIRALADKLLDQPVSIEVARRNTTAETVAQRIYPVDRERKRELLAHLVKTHDWHQVLVFTRTKHGANRLAEQLSKDGIPALAIHGNKSQSARTRALSEFKGGTLRVLVATDIAARGIDIDQLPHVVNFDLPNVSEDYVHRIGRTGRAGAEGEAISLVCIDEHGLLRDIERLIKRELPRTVLPGFEPDPTIAAEPIPNGRQSRNAPRGAPRAPRNPANNAPRQAKAPAPQGQPRHEGASGNRGNSSGNPARADAGSAHARGKPVQGNGQGRPASTPAPRHGAPARAPQARPAQPAARQDAPAGHSAAGRTRRPHAALLGGGNKS